MTPDEERIQEDRRRNRAEYARRQAESEHRTKRFGSIMRELGCGCSGAHTAKADDHRPDCRLEAARREAFPDRRPQ